MTSEASPHSGPTVVAPGPTTHAVIWGGFALLGAAAGWLLEGLAGWAVSLPWLPFRGPLELVDSIPDPWAGVAAIAVGLVLGLVVAYLALKDYLTVTIGDDEMTLVHGDYSRTMPRTSVGAVFRDGKELVVLGTSTGELARAGGDVDVEELDAAFRAHDYPWLPDGDPHAEDYRRWVDGLPALSPGAHALFKARARALDKKESDDVRQLREELGRLDVVVHDVKKQQYWRVVRAVPGGADDADGARGA